ncbi:dTDP-4-dehydrorhamnose reductase [Flaviramulus sp. BrNp1-15]|nr:dTDP-4-dehydrorhamnose reductase [Flaviramulus sp. BrNp1-15]ULC60963.1 dTDP-4-dehydrorhamnose reductase [Flaviramulus sp. BrNp1-15]
MKVLVTGSRGQLGKTIEELYLKNKLGLDFTFVTKTELDITNHKSVKSFFSQKKFDYCINCAAYTNVEQAEKTPEIAFKINAEGVKYLAESCKASNVVLIHISTDYVFDGEKQEPYLETDLTNPINKYGESKLLGEEYIKNILKKYFIIRTSWLYSKKHGKNFYKSILKKAKTEKELFVTNEQTGCPTETDSLAKFIIDLIIIDFRNYGVKHFSDGIVMTWYDFAKHILSENNLINKTTLVKANKYVTFASRPKYTVLKTNLNNV